MLHYFPSLIFKYLNFSSLVRLIYFSKLNGVHNLILSIELALEIRK